MLLLLLAVAAAQTGNAAAIYREGLAELDQEHPYRAIELFKQAQTLNPSYIDPLISLATAYYYMDEYDEALRYVQKAIPLGKDNTRLLNINGRILLALGKTAEAATIFKTILAREPYNVDALLGIAEFDLSRGDEINALSQYQKSLQYNPKDRRILLSLSLMYETKGDRNKSEQYLLKALDAWAESPMVQAMAAEYYLRRQDWAQALFHAQTALALAPGYGKALQLLGTIHLRTAKYPDAVAIMDQLIKLDPEDPLAWYQRGMAFLQQQKPAEALQSFEKVLGLTPNDEITRIVLEDTVDQHLVLEDPARSRYAAYHFDQATQFRKKNLFQRAEFHYRRGLRIAPMDNGGRQQYADFLKATNQRALFLQQLRILSDAGVKNTFVKDNLEIYASLLSDSVAASWVTDQFLVERDPLLFRQYYILPRQVIEHPLAESYLERYVQTLLLTSPKLSMNQDRTENSSRLPPVAVENESKAFAAARGDKADYYVLVDLSESRDDFQARVSLCLARTGNALRTYNAYRSGNFCVQNAIWQVCESLQREMPLRGRLLKRNLDEGLINLGANDGLKPGDVLTMVSPDSFVLKGDSPGFLFQQDKKTGSFTVSRTDDLIAAGAVKREGFFDRINLGDVILRDGESLGKNLEPTANFPFLYNKIRAIR
jgi:tetratricopeptide (TPR) repeat protein